jgi:hypothetical protein
MLNGTHGAESAGECTLFSGKGNENLELTVHKQMISAIKRVVFVTDKNVIRMTKMLLMSYHCSECSCPNS